MLEILIWVHYKEMWIKNLSYMSYQNRNNLWKGKFVGDFNMGNIICANFYVDNVTHIKISNKLIPSINYFLILMLFGLIFRRISNYKYIHGYTYSILVQGIPKKYFTNVSLTSIYSILSQIILMLFS